MKILVIDDSEVHRNAALILLADHDITVVENIRDAEWRQLQEEPDVFGDPNHNIYTNPGKYDVVLTDLAMPGEDGTPLPLGLSVVAMALKSGVQKVAVVSTGGEEDGPGSNHHGHPFVRWATHHFYEIPGRLWLFAEHRCPKTELNGVMVKDWKKVLDTILAE